MEWLKLNQLIKVKQINEIILSTDDKKIKFAKKFNNKKIKYYRPKKLSTSKTKTDNLIKYAGNLFNKNEHVLWTLCKTSSDYLSVAIAL